MTAAADARARRGAPIQPAPAAQGAGRRLFRLPHARLPRRSRSSLLGVAALRRRRRRRSAALSWDFLTASRRDRSPAELGHPGGALGHDLADGRLRRRSSSRSASRPRSTSRSTPTATAGTTALIEVNIQNLAAVPSIVYGILGLAFLVRGPLGLGPRRAGGRPHARPARAAGGDHRRARGDPGGAAVDPRGLAGARRDAVADDLAAGAARRRSPASRPA